MKVERSFVLPIGDLAARTVSLDEDRRAAGRNDPAFEMIRGPARVTIDT